MRASGILPEESVRAVLEMAEALAGVSLGERGELLAGMAVRRALIYCQREDVPEDMEQATAVLLLALAGRFPQSGGDVSDGENAGEDAASSGAVFQGASMEGAVKSIRRGDTTITFDTSAGASSEYPGYSGSGTSGESFPGEAAALAALAPWRRRGGLKK